MVKLLQKEHQVKSLKIKVLLQDNSYQIKENIYTYTRRRGQVNFLICLEHLEIIYKNVNVSIPLGCFVSITGVSGSGKSTLINQTLLPILNQKFILVAKNHCIMNL